MALDDNTRRGFDGRELPLDLPYDSPIVLHQGYGEAVVAFLEWTGEVALPRKGGAVARFAFLSTGWTDTAVAGELSLPGASVSS